MAWDAAFLEPQVLGGGRDAWSCCLTILRTEGTQGGPVTPEESDSRGLELGALSPAKLSAVPVAFPPDVVCSPELDCPLQRESLPPWILSIGSLVCLLILKRLGYARHRPQRV